MRKMENKIIAFNYFGGKYTWVEQLYNLFPKHIHFVDLMCGSMSVTLNKKPSLIDTANDLDGSVVNFFQVLRNKPEELINSLELTPVSREEYKNCFPIFEPGISDIEHARRFFVRCRQSFQVSGIKEHTGFNACINTSDKGVSKNISKFYSAVDKLPNVIERLKEIQIENKHYLEIIEQYDRPGTFFYVDPPYELRKRNYKKWYAQEFNHDEDHVKLAETLNKIKGKAMVSGYESDLYLEIYKDWNFIKLKPKKHAMKNGKLQQECIWINYELEEKDEINLFSKY